MCTAGRRPYRKRTLRKLIFSAGVTLGGNGLYQLLLLELMLKSVDYIFKGHHNSPTSFGRFFFFGCWVSYRQGISTSVMLSTYRLGPQRGLFMNILRIAWFRCWSLKGLVGYGKKYLIRSVQFWTVRSFLSFIKLSHFSNLIWSWCD